MRGSTGWESLEASGEAASNARGPSDGAPQARPNEAVGEDEDAAGGCGAESCGRRLRSKISLASLPFAVAESVAAAEGVAAAKVDTVTKPDTAGKKPPLTPLTRRNLPPAPNCTLVLCRPKSYVHP
jgi:hypothetical protein